MEKYTEPKLVLIELSVNDVITTSGTNTCTYDNTGEFEGEWVCFVGTSR